MKFAKALCSDWVTYVILGSALFAVFAFVAWYSWAHRGDDEYATTSTANRRRVYLSEVHAVLFDPAWRWTRNRRCRSVTILVDTRSRPRVCEIYDRYGDPLTLDELMSQTPERGLD